MQTALLWSGSFRYFPRLQSPLNFQAHNISGIENVMIVNGSLHRQFRRFSLAFGSTGTRNHDRQDIPSVCFAAAHDGSYPLHSPMLLQAQHAIASIFHVTGAGAEINRAPRDYDTLGGLASDGSTDISLLLSVGSFALLSKDREHTRIQPARSKSRDEQNTHSSLGHLPAPQSEDRR